MFYTWYIVFLWSCYFYFFINVFFFYLKKLFFLIWTAKPKFFWSDINRFICFWIKIVQKDKKYIYEKYFRRCFRTSFFTYLKSLFSILPYQYHISKAFCDSFSNPCFTYVHWYTPDLIFNKSFFFNLINSFYLNQSRRNHKFYF